MNENNFFVFYSIYENIYQTFSLMMAYGQRPSVPAMGRGPDPCSNT